MLSYAASFIVCVGGSQSPAPAAPHAARLRPRGRSPRRATERLCGTMGSPWLSQAWGLGTLRPPGVSLSDAHAVPLRPAIRGQPFSVLSFHVSADVSKSQGVKYPVPGCWTRREAMDSDVQTEPAAEFARASLKEAECQP